MHRALLEGRRIYVCTSTPAAKKICRSFRLRAESNALLSLETARPETNFSIASDRDRDYDGWLTVGRVNALLLGSTHEPGTHVEGVEPGLHALAD
jgi:hypothetical protein